MQEFLQLSFEERALYFRQATAQSSTIKNPIFIEKDFWVCWVLDVIFSTPILSENVIFKGGTSLSKCYGIIQRFSEDIDLTLSREFIGINEDNDPATIDTTNQRGKRIEQLKKKVVSKISLEIKPLLENEFRKKLSSYVDANNWSLVPDEDDEQALIFNYPRSLTESSEYVKSSVKLEFGGQGSLNPNEPQIITPYLFEFLPIAFETTPKIIVYALSAKRTFWEKITLLHAEHHRDINQNAPTRLFRHYYDIVMLHEKKYSNEAMEEVSLLSDVVNDTRIYFPRKWANYDLAKIGTLRLFPNEKFILQLKSDSEKMSDMFFGDTPTFDEVMENIRGLEKMINEMSE